MGYHALPSYFKKMYINIVLKNMIVTRANALQIAQNQANPQENIQ